MNLANMLLFSLLFVATAAAPTYVEAPGVKGATPARLLQDSPMPVPVPDDSYEMPPYEPDFPKPDLPNPFPIPLGWFQLWLRPILGFGAKN